MKDSTSNQTPAGSVPANPTNFERRLALLETEVGLDFPELLPQLKSGLRLVFIKAKQLAAGLHPDLVRRVCGMIVLCHHYGATVVISKDDNVYEIGDEPSA